MGSSSVASRASICSMRMISPPLGMSTSLRAAQPQTAQFERLSQRLRCLNGVDDALGVLKGFRVRLSIDAEKELQILGCGWRIVTCRFRANKVRIHHNGNAATMKRKNFKELLAAKRLLRKRPNLRLVVSNPVGIAG